jgi:hypothetical protein
MKGSRYLVITSLGFFIPSIIAYIQGEYFLSSVIATTSLISANYWRRPELGWRRNADLIVSKAAFSIFLITGIQVVSYPCYLAMCYSGLILMIHCYSNACLHNCWKYHAAFHILVSTEIILILHNIK